MQGEKVLYARKYIAEKSGFTLQILLKLCIWNLTEISWNLHIGVFVFVYLYEKYLYHYSAWKMILLQQD